MDNINIGFIGGGNMATALIGGLVASGFAPARLYVSDTNPQRLTALSIHQVQTTENSQELVDQCDVIVLAVKPQSMHRVLSDLRFTRDNQLLLSIAAGVRTQAILQWIGKEIALVRAMPNTPALMRSAATGLYATHNVTRQQHEIAEHIMRAVGITIWLDEEIKIDAVTAISGSGPAYFFYLMEAMEATARELGLDNNTAHLLTVQTAFGAAKLALEVEDSPTNLRERVTSPGGTTEQAINHMQKHRLQDILRDAIKAAEHRSRELAAQLEKSP
jgi:pyrroline-5-carboxylate reductase